jgi:ketosteroid isomerase-like protein
VNDITTFLSAWSDAERTRDIAFLDEHLTDDFVGIGPLGFTLPKPAWLARHQGDELRYETFDLDETDVHDYGPVTVVTARQTAIGAFQGNPVPRCLRDSIVLVDEGHGLRLARVHMSFVAGTPGAPPLPGMPAPAVEDASARR